MDIKIYVKQFNYSFDNLKSKYEEDFNSLYEQEKEWLGNLEDKVHLLKNSKHQAEVNAVIGKLKTDDPFTKDDTKILSTFVSKVNTIVRIANRINNFKEETKLDDGSKLELYKFFNSVKNSTDLNSFNYSLNSNLSNFLPHIYSVIKHCQNPNEYPIYYKNWKNIIREVLTKNDDYNSVCDFYRSFPELNRHLNFATYLGTIGIQIAKNINASGISVTNDSKEYKYLTQDVINIERYNSILDEYLNSSHKYFLVGAYWDGSNPSDQTERFIKNGIWENGYEDKFNNDVKKVPVGSHIAIKAVFTREKTKSVMAIKARGIVLKNYDDGLTLDVEWEDNFIPFEVDFSGGYWATIKEVKKINHIDAIWYEKPDNNVKIENLKQMNFPLNQILYGPPGTGKTYNTINTALAICGDNIERLNRKEIKELYQKRVEEGRIVFTTFHQSMTYEDFVEGIKPKMSEDNESEVSYEIEEGIFKSICNKAENESLVSSSNDNFDEVWEKLIDFTRTKLLNGELVKIGSWDYGLSSRDSLKYSSMNTPSKYNFTITKQNVYDAYRNKKARPSGAFQKDMEDVVDFMKSQFGLNNYQENEGLNKTKSQNYVLIIDEINRGNVSQIFGELITLIEEDKRLGNPEAIQVQLPYSKDWFGVPPNVHIIGTMNTADRSVEALDTALRRRFSFTEMPPNPELINTEGKAENGIINGIELSALLETINKRIEKLLDKDHMIGHSYFLSVEGLKGLKSAFQNKIVPLLQEYFFGDYGKIGLVIGSKFFDIKDNQVDEDFFAPFEDYDSSPLVERKVYHLKNIQDMSDELFIEALHDLQRKNK